MEFDVFGCYEECEFQVGNIEARMRKGKEWRRKGGENRWGRVCSDMGHELEDFDDDFVYSDEVLK